MIEPTDEMEEAFDDAAYPLGLSKPDVQLGLAAVFALVERDYVAPLRALVEEFVDPDPCQFDHHGYCQAHSLDPAPCPHQRAKDLP